MKLCQKCKETKPLAEFYKDSSRADGLTYKCKICTNASNKCYAQTDKGREKSRAKYKKWRDANLDLARKISREGNRCARVRDPRRFLTYGLRYLYGITLDQYESLLTRQKGGCAICGATEPGGKGSFHVDHCHNSSQVRGLLCSNCNTGLGKFKDSASLLASAINYLSEAGAKS